MKVGLYSELARENIIKIRKEINKFGIGSSNDEIKLFRDTIVESSKGHHKSVVKSNDFYSLSTVKDLLFHVQEHMFDIPSLNDHLNKLGLKFCGFESPEIISHFKLTNKSIDDPYDLAKWHSYEKLNPTAFCGMYQFWCQKVD